MSDIQFLGSEMRLVVGEPLEEPKYAGADLTALASRCAEAAAAWGTDKVAAHIEPIMLFKNPEAHPLVLLMMVSDRYGEPSLLWEPSVLQTTLLRDNVQVSGANMHKINAARALASSPSPWRQWHTFHWCTRGLAGAAVNFHHMEMPALGHQMAALDMMAIVDPPRQTSTEVDRFIAATLRNEGHVFAPPPLNVAQRALESKKLACKTCDAEFEDNNDARCITCGSEHLHPAPDQLGGLRAQVAQQFEARKGLPLERALEGLGNTPADNLCYDLLVHSAYARDVRSQLLHQMRALSSR